MYKVLSSNMFESSSKKSQRSRLFSVSAVSILYGYLIGHRQSFRSQIDLLLLLNKTEKRRRVVLYFYQRFFVSLLLFEESIACFTSKRRISCHVEINKLSPSEAQVWSMILFLSLLATLFTFWYLQTFKKTIVGQYLLIWWTILNILDTI